MIKSLAVIAMVLNLRNVALVNITNGLIGIINLNIKKLNFTKIQSVKKTLENTELWRGSEWITLQ